MNILQISSASSFGGGERYVVDLTNALVARGHDVYVAVRPGSPLPRHLQLSPEKLLTLPLRNALDVQTARELEKFVGRKKIEVVHAHMARDYSLASYAARRNRGTKFIATRHVLFKLNRLHRHTLSRATCVIAVSQAVAKELRTSQVVSHDQIAVIHNGIDVDRIKKTCAGLHRGLFLRSIGIAGGNPGGGPLVGSIGELRTLKRHDDFVRAAALILKEFPETQFVLAGVGEGRNQLENLVAELGLTGRFHFLGWLDDADKLLCAMDVFVSASETESFGLAIVEAMAAGTAVVATATEGAKEVIDDQNTGLLVPIGDVKRIAESVVNLLSDPEKRQRLATQSVQSAAKRFSLTRMVDDIETIYLRREDEITFR
ncbi:MAG TPA: glycosyltransferase family 4 protein [Pyrinomonadaceae bacterium]|nr:glycosyltransferase family 4 protein [Pyrinomonadaceae bacterium]